MKTAILSDIHGNLPALTAVLEDVERQSCERIWILGDIINGHSPRACLERVRSLPGEMQVIQGNAELYLATPDLDRMPYQDDPDNANLIRLIRWFRQRLPEDGIAWLENLPETFCFGRSFLAHDSPLDRLEKQRWQQPGIPQPYQEWFFHAPGLHEDMPAAAWAELVQWMDANGVDRLFVGHTHVPWIKEVGAKVICNAGSAGFTLDGDLRPSWVLLEEQPGTPDRMTIRRVTYDVSQALALIDAAPDYPSFEYPGRREAYKQMLRTGLHWRVHIKTTS